MGIKPLLGCFVIIGRYQKQPVCPCLFGFHGQIDSGLRTVGARSRHNRDPPVYLLHTVSDHVNMLLMGQRRGLPCGSADNNRVRPFRDLELNQLRKFLIVNCPVFLKRCNDGNSGAGKNSHNFSLL